jgi:hypothetical protein
MGGYGLEICAPLLRLRRFPAVYIILGGSGDSGLYHPPLLDLGKGEREEMRNIAEDR